MKEYRIVVPGRVNLIGEHIDYYNLPVFPMAIGRYITLQLQPSTGDLVHLESTEFGVRSLHLSDAMETSSKGDWANYLKASVRAVKTNWQVRNGFYGQITSTLPAAAGLSSSSALITAIALGLLRANGIEATLAELMQVLPEGEHFVGTRGGGMDHASVLASRQGYASLIHFAPFAIEYVGVPEDWRFLVANSLVKAEKSGAARDRYNALSGSTGAELHKDSESHRVTEAVAAMRTQNRAEFGKLLNNSHESLRNNLKVSCPELDRIVEIARHACADGARLTGAGFGGCVIILCTDNTKNQIVDRLELDFYAGKSAYSRERDLIFVSPSNGALYAGSN